MSVSMAEWTRPKAVDLVTIRCAGCGTIFTRVLGTLHPPKGAPFVEIECVCKNRQCRKTFTVKVGVVGMAA